MIEIRNLVKEYKSSKKHITTAVNNISLTLPNTGMVFIVGKSGSGKSSLLNIIGSLDNITSGEIIVDGLNLSSASYKTLEEYRSSYLGFIFQDFLLLDEFTVEENIHLALNISGIEEEGLVEKTLKLVDLEGIGDKYPNELSGGQKQRVAIARALVKNPKLLLCDEPTGNLDYITSEQILKFLKKQSENKLVIIVSHNLEDAEKYADRIIELFEGNILSDKSIDLEYNNSYQEYDDFVVFPHHQDLTKHNIDSLNTIIKDRQIEIRQDYGGFKNTIVKSEEPNNMDTTSSNLTFNNSIKLSSMFYRKNKKGVPYTILLLTLFISLLYIFQVFVMFDGNKSMVLPKEGEAIRIVNLTEQTTQGTLSTAYFYPITNSDVTAYKEAGYSGNIYTAYNYCFNMGLSYLSTGRTTRFGLMFDYNYVKETTGTICCDQEYLINLYGVDGKLKVLEGTLDEIGSKIIITDYTADCMLNYSPSGLSNYSDVLKKYKRYVCAIIDTNYKERYKQVIEHGKLAEEQKLSQSEYAERYSKRQDHIDFLQEVQDYLSLTYAFCSPDEFYSKIFKASTNSTNISNFYVEKEGATPKFYEGLAAVSLDSYSSFSLKNDEIVMSYGLYQSLFGKEYNDTTRHLFEPHKITIKKYAHFANDSELIYEKELTVKSVYSTTYVNSKTLAELEKSTVVPYSLYFDKVEEKEIIYSTANEQGHLIYTLDTTVVPVVNTIIALFRGFCYLIICLLVIASLVYIILHGVNSIKKNIYEIGVLKALGTKNHNISLIFMVQIVITGILAIFVSIFGIIIFSNISNHLLVEAFEDFMTIKIFGLSIIAAYPKIVSLDLSLVFLGTVISSIIPLIYLRTLKPLNILKGNKK